MIFLHGTLFFFFYENIPGSKSSVNGGGPGSPGSPSRQQSKILRGPTRRIGMEQKTASIQVKQVQVKHIERNVANIRATKEMNARDITGKRYIEPT